MQPQDLIGESPDEELLKQQLNFEEDQEAEKDKSEHDDSLIMTLRVAMRVLNNGKKTIMSKKGKIFVYGSYLRFQESNFIKEEKVLRINYSDIINCILEN